MKKNAVLFLLFSVLTPFLLFSQIGNTEKENKTAVSAIQNKSLNKLTPASEGTVLNKLYMCKKIGLDGEYHLFNSDDLSGSSVIRGAVPGGQSLNEGTIDNNGFWWGISNDLGWTALNKINPATGAILSSLLIAAPGLSVRGIAFNPTDNHIYYLICTGMDEFLCKINPQNSMVVPALINYPGETHLWGLACTSDGVLYSMNDAIVTNQKLVRLSTTNPLDNVLIGSGIREAGVFALHGYCDLEIDRLTNKLYMSTQNAENFDHAGIWEIDKDFGFSTLVKDFGTNDIWSGMAFNNKLLINAPHADQVLYANDEVDIEWIGGAGDNLKIEFSSNNGAAWSSIVSDIAGSDGRYTWQLPNISSSNCKIRISSLNDPALTTTSSIFEIRKAFQFISGNGGENWSIGSQQVVSWYTNYNRFLLAKNADQENEVNGIPHHINVKLEYSTTGINGPWILVASNIVCYSNQVTSYTFTAPSVITNQGMFRITSQRQDARAAEGSLGKPNRALDFIGYSDYCWSTYSSSNTGKYLITSPNGREELTSGENKYITWIKTGGVVSGSTFLEYSIDGGLTWIRINTTPIAGIMRYNWKVPDVNSNKCLVRMCNYLTRREIDRSDSYFTISNTGSQAVNFPNPFNPSTKIMFKLDKSEMTSLRIYNSIGQEVAVLVNKQLEAGSHSFEFNASNLPSGVYFYNLTRDGKTEVHKMMLLK